MKLTLDEVGRNAPKMNLGRCEPARNQRNGIPLDSADRSAEEFGLNAFSESLRQEVLGSKVRVGVVEPGTVSTELTTHLRRGSREASDRQVSAIEQLHPSDIADAVHYMVTRSARVAVNEMLVRAAAQTW